MQIFSSNRSLAMKQRGTPSVNRKKTTQLHDQNAVRGVGFSRCPFASLYPLSCWCPGNRPNSHPTEDGESDGGPGTRRPLPGHHLRLTSVSHTQVHMTRSQKDSGAFTSRKLPVSKAITASSGEGMKKHVADRRGAEIGVQWQRVYPGMRSASAKLKYESRPTTR